MSQQGDAHPGQEDDWWRQLYDEDAASDASRAARGTGQSIDEHFDSAVDAMSPPPPPRSETMRLRRPTPPPPPPSWPRPTRNVPPAPRDPEEPPPAASAPPEDAAAPRAGVPAQPGEREGAVPLVPQAPGERDDAPVRAADEPAAAGDGGGPAADSAAGMGEPGGSDGHADGHSDGHEDAGGRGRSGDVGGPTAPGAWFTSEPLDAPGTAGEPYDLGGHDGLGEADAYLPWGGRVDPGDPEGLNGIGGPDDSGGVAGPGPARPEPGEEPAPWDPWAAPPTFGPPPEAPEPAEPEPEPRPWDVWSAPPTFGEPAATPAEPAAEEAPAAEPDERTGRPAAHEPPPAQPWAAWVTPRPRTAPPSPSTPTAPSAAESWSRPQETAPSGETPAEPEAPPVAPASEPEVAAAAPESEPHAEHPTSAGAEAAAETSPDWAPFGGPDSFRASSGHEAYEEPESRGEGASASEAYGGELPFVEAELPGPESSAVEGPQEPSAEAEASEGWEPFGGRVRESYAESELSGPESPAVEGPQEPSAGAEVSEGWEPFGGPDSFRASSGHEAYEEPQSRGEGASASEAYGGELPYVEPELPRPEPSPAEAPLDLPAEAEMPEGWEPFGGRGIHEPYSEPESSADAEAAGETLPVAEASDGWGARVGTSQEPYPEADAEASAAPEQPEAYGSVPSSAEVEPGVREVPAVEAEPSRPVGLFEVPPAVPTGPAEPVAPVSPHVPFTDPPPESPRTTTFAEGEVRWAPELPPGWEAADAGRRAERSDDLGEPEVVGGGPPTYGAEPTAWPEADPDELDGLVPDTVLDGAQYGRLTMRAAAFKGDSARYRGQPRRDALLTARFGSGDDALLLVAVASGARGADASHQAAQDAVRWIAGAVGRSRSRLAGDLRAARRGSLKSGLHRLTDRCYGRLRARGEELGLPEGDYTASLRCLLLPIDPECRIRLFFGLGEGGLFRIRGGSWQDLDLAPDAATAPFRFRATVAQPGDALLMCSAGMAEPLRGEPELAVHLAERWGSGRVPGLAAYLSDAQTRVKGYADDRTAVTVWDA